MPQRRPLPPWLRALTLAIGLATPSAGLGGCTTTPPSTVAERHPTRIDVVAVALPLAVNPASGAITPAERERTARAVVARAGDTALHASVAGQPLSSPARAAVTVLLGEAGVDADNVVFSPDGTSGTTLLLTRYVALAPDCRNWGDIEKGWFENAPTGILGCSTQRNLSLMLADPRDLLEGRETRPADGARMAGAVQRYRTDRVKKLPSDNAATSMLPGPGLATPAPAMP